VNPPALRRDLHVIAARCRVSDFPRPRVSFRTRRARDRPARRRILDENAAAIDVKSA
jgi:hypothetical protein